MLGSLRLKFHWFCAIKTLKLSSRYITKYWYCGYRTTTVSKLNFIFSKYKSNLKKCSKIISRSFLIEKSYLFLAANTQAIIAMRFNLMQIFFIPTPLLPVKSILPTDVSVWYKIYSDTLGRFSINENCCTK